MVKLYIHQHTNSFQPWYGLSVVSLNGKYLAKDGTWRVNCYEQDDEDKYICLWDDNELSGG